MKVRITGEYTMLIIDVDNRREAGLGVLPGAFKKWQ